MLRVLSRSRCGACKLGDVRVILPEGRGHQYRKIQKGNSFIIIGNLVKGSRACDIYPDTGEVPEERYCDLLRLFPGSGLDGRGQLSRKHTHVQSVRYSGSIFPGHHGSCRPVYDLLIRRRRSHAIIRIVCGNSEATVILLPDDGRKCGSGNILPVHLFHAFPEEIPWNRILQVSSGSIIGQILSCLVGGIEGIEFGLSLGDAYPGLVFPLRLTGTERKQAAVHIPVLLFVENHQCYSGLCGNLGKQRAGLIPVGGIGRIIVQHLTPAGFNTPGRQSESDRYGLLIGKLFRNSSLVLAGYPDKAKSQ